MYLKGSTLNYAKLHTLSELRKNSTIITFLVQFSLDQMEQVHFPREFQDKIKFSKRGVCLKIKVPFKRDR